MIRRRKLLVRLWRNAVWAGAIIAAALVVGMIGYHSFGTNMDWVTAFANAAMILSGMGPLQQLDSSSGKLFEGAYALVSGLLFFAVAGFALAPALHHILRTFHLEDEETKKLH